jgi:hypothetical protein
LVAVANLWIAALLWIYVQPLAGTSFVLLSATLAIQIVLPQVPVAFVAGPMLGAFAICGVIYARIMPKLSSLSNHLLLFSKSATEFHANNGSKHDVCFCGTA